MKKTYLLALVFLVNFVGGQPNAYISRSQPAPSFSCPTVCPGSVLELEVFQVQNLNNGDELLAELSNANGSFVSGTTTLSCTRYSTDGTTWHNGPYLFSGNVNNLFIEITIPANLPVGSNYTILMKGSGGYVSNNLFSCGGTDSITVTSAYPVLSPLAATTEGNNQWVAHVYSWTATVPTGTKLITNTLVNAQDFFDSTNYIGYFLKDSLSFDINYQTASGGTCPGAPGALNDGTSIPCSQGFSQLFSVKMLRKENFPTGTYRLSIAGDDGIRLSIDGGKTWLLSSFYEQVYDTSTRNTNAQYPNGICLSGPTDLVIEYYQRLVDARLTFTATLLSTTSVGDAGNQSGCTGSNVAFALSGSTNGLSYQWYYSTNGGSSFSPVPNTAPFSGATSSTLNIASVPSSYNNYLFRCQVTGLCGNPINTAVDTLFVSANGTPGNLSAGNQSGCTGSNVTFQLNSNSNSLTYVWYYSTNGGTSFAPVPGNATFSGVNTSALTITSIQPSYNNYLFRCLVSGSCGNPVNSAVDTLFVGGAGAPATINASKNDICPSDSSNICVQGTCNTCTYLWNTGATSQCITANQAGNYYATVTYGTGCSAASNHLALNVLPTPSVSITVLGDTLTNLSSSISQQWYNGNSPIPGATHQVYIAPGPGLYSVMITDSNGCQELSNPIGVGMGVSNLTQQIDFAIYPNPVAESGQIVITAQAELFGKTLQIFDVSGQLVIQTKIRNAKTELDLSTLATGVYVAKMGGVTKKFVKE